jgi:hypothetical protein
MEISLILLIIGFLLVAFLIFKLIKKVIVAIVTIVITFVLLVGGVVGLVYLDINNLTSNTNYNVQVVYEKDDNYLLGLKLDVENNSVDVENIQSIPKSNLDDLKTKELKKDDNTFVIIIPEESFDKVIVNSTYDYSEFLLNDENFEGLNLELTGEEVKFIIESNDPNDEFINVLLKDTIMSDEELEIVRNVIQNSIETQMNSDSISINELLFAYTISQSIESKDKFRILFSEYKKKNIEIYPDRITFKMFRILPLDTILNIVE